MTKEQLTSLAKEAMERAYAPYSALAVTGGKDGVIRGAFYPCGVCRQVIREFCDGFFPIYVLAENGRILTHSLSDLLPHSFSNKDM